MAYIGNAPAEAYSTISKQTITGNGTTGPYTLDYAVANGNEIEVFVNNVRQEPAVAYTVSGTALTMTGAVSSSDDFYVVFHGKAVQTIVPADATVTTAMLQDSSVTSAKIAAGTVTAADLASTLDLSGKTVTLPAGTGGKVLQVVSASKEDVFSTSSTSFTDVTGLSVDITPTSTSSKILVQLNIAHSASAGTLNNEVRILENGSNIHAVNSLIRVQTQDTLQYAVFTELRSPATTNTITYKAQVQSESASYTLYINRRGAATYVAVSSITVMEIAG